MNHIKPFQKNTNEMAKKKGYINFNRIEMLTVFAKQISKLKN